MSDGLRNRTRRVTAISTALCTLTALANVAGQGASCAWSAEESSCLPDPAGFTFTEAELTESLEALANTAECDALFDPEVGCSSETVGCTTVSFTDAPGMVVCAPVGNTWTTAEEWLEVIAAWSECEEGVGAGCEAAANEYFSKNTGCASCGGLAHELLNGLKECGEFVTSTSCGGGATAATEGATTDTTAGTTADSSPAPGIAPLTPTATGNVEAVCLWGTESCQALPVGKDILAADAALIKFYECFDLNSGFSNDEVSVSTASGCPAGAPTACSTFFDDTSAPWCLPTSATWTDVEDFGNDVSWLTPECLDATPECVSAAQSFFAALGCTECAEEAEAWVIAAPACLTATTEAECTADLAQEGTLAPAGSTGSGTTASPTTGTTSSPTTGSPTTLPSPTPSSPTGPSDGTELTFGPDSPSTDATDATGATAESPTEPDVTTTPTDSDTTSRDTEASGLFPESDSNDDVVQSLTNAAPHSYRGLVSTALIGAVAVVASLMM